MKKYKNVNYLSEPTKWVSINQHLINQEADDILENKKNCFFVRPILNIINI